MEEKTLDSLIEVISQRQIDLNNRIADYYEKVDNALNEIISTRFMDLNDGELFVFPFGDYISDTICDTSIVDFYVVYRTKRENVNFAVVYEKQTKKGKRVSTYQSIVGGATVKNVMQAEDVAKRISYFLEQSVACSQMYQRRNEIVFNLSNDLTARITVCYDFELKNGDFRQRKVNRWININPTKYLSKIEEKNEQTNNNYSKFVMLFKALEIELIILEKSQLLISKNGFVENLLYNVPNELFIGTNMQVLNQILNYLKLKNLDNYELISETGKMFNKQDLIYSKNYAKQFINKIIYATDNFEKFYE